MWVANMTLRIHFHSLLLTVSTLALSFIFLYNLFVISSNSTSLTIPSKVKPIHILIVSSWRSGSSFIGQIFNRHPDVFYIFEPGHPVWMKMKNEKSEFLHYPVRDLLHSLFTCDVSPLLYYLPLGGKQVSELKFFAESRALCVPPACKATIPLEGYDRVMCSYRCRTSPIEVMAETCRTHSHIAMKTVRIFDLQVLLPLFRDPLMDLRIVHMVRDPRAVLSSRKSFELDADDNIVLRKEMEEKNITPNLVHVMGKICKAQVAINKFARSANSSLRGRYMMIRHEELAWGPIQRAKKLYSFSGLNMTSELESFVYNITHVNKQDTGTFMSFSRKSPEVVSRWRKRLNYSTVMEIQNVCQEAMEVFGYIPVWSMRDLRDVSFNIVAEREALEDE